MEFKIFHNGKLYFEGVPILLFVLIIFFLFFYWHYLLHLICERLKEMHVKKWKELFKPSLINVFGLPFLAGYVIGGKYTELNDLELNKLGNKAKKIWHSWLTILFCYCFLWWAYGQFKN